MKKVLVVLLAVFTAATAFAGDRFNGLTYSNALEGIILDREVNGVDVLRNPANMSALPKMRFSIDSAAYGTTNASPFSFNLAMPMGSMIIGGSIRYGNANTVNTWQLTAPLGALAINGALANDSNTTLVETLTTGVTTDDWTKTTVYSGTRNVIGASGGRMDILGSLAMKMGDQMTIGVKAGMELNSDGKTTYNSNYAYNVTEVVPLDTTGVAADESFAGTRALTREQNTATDPTAIKVVAGALLKLGGMDLDISALARLKSGDVSDKATASENVDIDPDLDGDENAAQDWIGLNTYLTTGRRSGSQSITRNYTGAVGGMDLGAAGILRMNLNPSTTLAIPVFFSSTPYNYTQARTDVTRVTAISTVITGGVANTSTYIETTSDTYSCDYASSTVGIGGGLNHKGDTYTIGIGLKILSGGTETTVNDGADNFSCAGNNTDAASTGVTNYSQTITNQTNSIRTVTKTSNSSVYIPLGIEGKITDRLMLRGGITQAWLSSRSGVTTTTTTTPSVTDSTTDGVVAATIIGATQTNTVITNTLPETVNNTMCTYYSLGFGYTVTDNLTIDVSTDASAGGNILDTGNIRASAVLIF